MRVSCESSRARPWVLSPVPTGSPRSKYEHQRASVLLRIIQNIRICMRRKPIVSVTYENERISIKKKNSLPYLICVLRLSCVVHRPIYGRFLSLLCHKGKKAITFSPNSTRLIRTPVYTDKRSTDSHKKPSSLMRTLNYLMCCT